MAKKAFFVVLGILVIALAMFAYIARSSRIDAENAVAISNLSEMEIVIGHTICYGRCPAYAIEIFGSGEVIFDGHAFTSTVGRVEESLQEQQLKELAIEIYMSGYFDLKDGEFCSEVTPDLPETFLIIKWNNLERVTGPCIEHTPERAIELARKLEDIVDTARWVEYANGGD